MKQVFLGASIEKHPQRHWWLRAGRLALDRFAD